MCAPRSEKIVGETKGENPCRGVPRGGKEKSEMGEFGERTGKWKKLRIEKGYDSSWS